MMRRVLFVMVACAAAMAAALPSAHAHAVCDKSEPAEGSRLDAAPDRVWCDFTEPLLPQSTMSIVNVCNRRVDDGKVEVVGIRMSVGMATDADGVYKVVWRTVSAVDGHPIAGSFSFTVNKAVACKSSAQSGGTPKPTPSASTTSATEDPSDDVSIPSAMPAPTDGPPAPADEQQTPTTTETQAPTSSQTTVAAPAPVGSSGPPPSVPASRALLVLLLVVGPLGLLPLLLARNAPE